MAAPAKPATGVEEPQPPIGIVLEGDLVSRPDALLALAVLNGLTAKGEARRVALGVTSPSIAGAQLADVIAEFYPTLPENAGFSTIGMGEGAPLREHPALAALLAQKATDGSPRFVTRVRRVIDTADDAVLIRNTLLAQHDGNAAIVLAGAAGGLVRLLALPGARAQLTAKVKQLVIAAGAYPSGRAEPTVAADVASFRALFREWPTPIVVVGAELGDAVRFPGAKVQALLAASPGHPVAAAYAAIGKMPYDAPTAGLAAVLHVVQPEAGHFTLSAPGTVDVLDDGRTRFTAGGRGQHRYLSAAPAQHATLLASYTSLVAAPPAPRPVRRKPPMMMEQKQDQNAAPIAPIAGGAR